MADKVAIIGTVPNSKAVGPYNDPEWDIWVCSPGNSQGGVTPRITEWFELHSLVDCKGPENAAWWPNYVKWLNTELHPSIPIWMQEKNDTVPRAQVFPRKPLMERWGPNKQTPWHWWTSSPAWMIGFAIHRGYKTIGIFGIDMASAAEQYTLQKAAFFRWFEICRELGIKMVIPLESSLAANGPLYGYAESSRHGRSVIIREIEAQQRIQQTEVQFAQIQQQLAYLKGGLEQLTFERRTWVSGYEDAEIDEEVAAVSQPIPTMMSGDQMAKNIGEGNLPPISAFQPNPGGVLVPIPRMRDPSKPPSAADFPDNPDAAGLLKPAKNGNGLDTSSAQIAPSSHTITAETVEHKKPKRAEKHGL